MRVEIRTTRWPLTAEDRCAARDRIRLAVGREAPALVRVCATLTAPAGCGTPSLRLHAVLRDGRRLAVEEAAGPDAGGLDGPRLLERVDRLAQRVARAVERSRTPTASGAVTRR